MNTKTKNTEVEPFPDSPYYDTTNWTEADYDNYLNESFSYKPNKN